MRCECVYACDRHFYNGVFRFQYMLCQLLDTHVMMCVCATAKLLQGHLQEGAEWADSCQVQVCCCHNVTHSSYSCMPEQQLQSSSACLQHSLLAITVVQPKASWRLQLRPVMAV